MNGHQQSLRCFSEKGERERTVLVVSCVIYLIVSCGKDEKEILQR